MGPPRILFTVPQSSGREFDEGGARASGFRRFSGERRCVSRCKVATEEHLQPVQVTESMHSTFAVGSLANRKEPSYFSFADHSPRTIMVRTGPRALARYGKMGRTRAEGRDLSW